MPPMRRPLLGAVVLGLLVSLLTGACSKAVDPDRALAEGLAQQQAGNIDAAAEQYQLVLDARPTDKYANYNLGVLEQTQRPRLAEGYYRAALDADPTFVPALFNLAILRTRAEATQEAIDLYLRVIAAQSDYAAAYLNVGLLYRDAGRSGQADRYVNEALALDPTLANRLSTTPVSPASPTASDGSEAPSSPSSTP
jgi:tetratricopeptide (TPR) repeat protein